MIASFAPSDRYAVAALKPNAVTARQHSRVSVPDQGEASLYMRHLTVGWQNLSW